MTWSSDWIGVSSPSAEPAPSAAAWTLDEISTRLARAYPGAVGGNLRDADVMTADERAALERHAELEEAYQRGREEGHQEAVSQAAEQIRTALATLDQMLARLKAGERAWLEHARENISALAVAVARHVIGRELTSDVHVVAELARRALTSFPIDEPLRVRLNPQDLSTLTLASTEDGGSIPIAASRDVRWIADPEVLPGGVVVEGRYRVVDGRVDHVLERIYHKLADG
jgi:flagellar assembly protein FliH